MLNESADIPFPPVSASASANDNPSPLAPPVTINTLPPRSKSAIRFRPIFSLGLGAIPTVGFSLESGGLGTVLVLRLNSAMVLEVGAVEVGFEEWIGLTCVIGTVVKVVFVKVDDARGHRLLRALAQRDMLLYVSWVVSDSREWEEE